MSEWLGVGVCLLWEAAMESDTNVNLILILILFLILIFILFDNLFY